MAASPRATAPVPSSSSEDVISDAAPVQPRKVSRQAAPVTVRAPMAAAVAGSVGSLYVYHVSGKDSEDEQQKAQQPQPRSRAGSGPKQQETTSAGEAQKFPPTTPQQQESSNSSGGQGEEEEYKVVPRRHTQHQHQQQAPPAHTSQAAQERQPPPPLRQPPAPPPQVDGVGGPSTSSFEHLPSHEGATTADEFAGVCVRSGASAGTKRSLVCAG